MGRKHKLSDAQIAEIIRLLETTSTSKIASQFDVHDRTIARLKAEGQIKRTPVVRQSRKLSDEQIARVVELLETTTISMQEIADQFGVHENTIANIKRVENVNRVSTKGRKKGSSRLSSEEEAEIIHLLKTSPLSLAKIGRQFGISSSTVQYIELRERIDRPIGARMSAQILGEKRGEIIRLLKETTLPMPKIAEQVGVHRNTVARIKDEEGIDRISIKVRSEEGRSGDLPDQLVLAIKKCLDTTDLSQKAIGNRFNVSASTVNKIATGKNPRWVRLITEVTDLLEPLPLTPIKLPEPCNDKIYEAAIGLLGSGLLTHDEIAEILFFRFGKEMSKSYVSIVSDLDGGKS